MGSDWRSNSDTIAYGPLDNQTRPHALKWAQSPPRHFSTQPQETISHVHRLFVFHPEENSHGILILVEAIGWSTNTITQQPLHLWGLTFGHLRGNHQILVLGLAIKALCQEQADILARFISAMLLSETLSSKVCPKRSDGNTYSVTLAPPPW